MDYFAQFVQKLWMTGGILMHSIHIQASDMGIHHPQPVDYKFCTPIVSDLTTRISTNFNSVHTFNICFPQVMHKLWVNYTHVIPQGFGLKSGMSGR